MRVLPLRILGPYVLVMALPASVAAQAPAGPELLVSGTAALGPGNPSVATDAAGNFVVSWVELDFLVSVHARRYDAQGTAQGTNIVVSQYLGYPARLSGAGVGSAPGGDFVVVWGVSYGVDRGRIEARRFSASGAPLGPAFQVSTYTTTTQGGPVVAVQPNGGFVVAWIRDDAIAARTFASNGSALGAEFTVPAGTAYRQGPAAIATDAAGGFVIVWAEDEDYGYDDQVRAQRYSAAGVPLGADFQVNGATGAFDWPSVAVQTDGTFLVAWSESVTVPPLVHTRRFAADGSPNEGQRTVRLLNPLENSSQTAVASLAGGGYMVAWSNRGVDESGRAVEAVRIDATGAPVGRPIVVNSTEFDDQIAPALAADPLGNAIAVWTGRRVTTRYDVFAQRFGRLGMVALDVDTAAGASSDGNHVLEPGEEADLRPTWRNNQGAAAALRGTLLSLSPPPDGATHTITDGAGSYGTVADGATQACIDCYAIRVGFMPQSPRWGLHWDVIATESVDKGAGTPSDGQARWHVHVGDSFTDVARASPFYRFVETLLHCGITAGCSDRVYCGASAVTRAQMAPFVLLAREGRGYAPGSCGAPLFADVPNNDPFCRWIEELARRGVVSGCGGGNYCPNDAVTREQMAVFLLRTLDPVLDPPACTTPVFADVPASSPFCRWIEELARRGVVTGCGGGNYCPSAPVTREQMAVFLTATFGLTLYGP